MKYVNPNARCLVCNKLGVDLHHVKTRKSGGSDHPSNLLPLCRSHHQEIHTLGLNAISMRYAKITMWLNQNNWIFDQRLRTWFHPKTAVKIIITNPDDEYIP